MLLSELMAGISEIKNDQEIDQLSVDSRMAMHNAIFYCLNGIKYDGHDYVNEAIENGAKVIVYSKDIPHDKQAIYIHTNNVNRILNIHANRFYAKRIEGIDKYVIFGNYGKSSVASFINYYLDMFSSCGYIGVLGIKYGRYNFESHYETLNLLENLEILSMMKEANVKNCTFEVNSSALYLQKVDGLKPNYLIYTTTDKDLNDNGYTEYFNNLKKYIHTSATDAKLILNSDDVSFKELREYADNIISYGMNTISDYQIRDVMISRNGINYKIVYKDVSYPVKSSLQGLSNVYNLTAAIVALHLKGYELEHLISYFENVPYVEGVMERVDEQYCIIVDSAYDLDSIEAICKYAAQVKQKNKAIGVISINYTDGDSRIKNIIENCEKYLDVIILTENESLQGEVMDILERCDKYVKTSRVVHCSMRSLAIENAIELMNKNDVTIIIGKGNEKFLSMGLGKTYYPGDKHYVQKYIDKRRKEENEISEVY